MKKSIKKEEFIKKSNKIHNNKYDYSKLEYTKIKDKGVFICPEHGEFVQQLQKHLYGQGCPICAYLKKFSTKEEFIKKSNKIHNNKYIYSEVIYTHNKNKVCIICPIHGMFYMRPLNHLQGCGCPRCKMSYLEKEIEKFLIENNIIYETQKRFEWLKPQSVDFYLPEYNIAIECQGIQHFKCVEYFGGQEEFKKRLELDLIKKKKCDENKIKLIYYSNIENFNIINNLDELLLKIKGEN